MAIVVVFSAIALVALALGVLWPKTYTSSTTILIQEDNIIQPLMEGRAVATGVTDRGRIAREVIYSRKILAAVLEEGGWLAAKPSLLEQERLAERLKAATVVRNGGENLIQISYKDSDPDRTFRVTRKFAEMFISESLAAKERESREAYEFIAARVEEYHRKLTGAEDRLKEFRAENQDARPGTATDVNASMPTSTIVTLKSASMPRGNRRRRPRSTVDRYQDPWSCTPLPGGVTGCGFCECDSE